MFLTHLGVDAANAWLQKDDWKSLLLSQFAHSAVLVGLAGIFPETASTGWWRSILSNDMWNWYFAAEPPPTRVIIESPARTPAAQRRPADRDIQTPKIPVMRENTVFLCTSGSSSSILHLEYFTILMNFLREHVPCQTTVSRPAVGREFAND